jgi:hypothetical protein
MLARPRETGVFAQALRGIGREPALAHEMHILFAVMYF